MDFHGIIHDTPHSRRDVTESLAQRLPYSGVRSLARQKEGPQVPIPDTIDEESESNACDVEARVRSSPPKKRRVMEDSATPKASTTGERRRREVPVMRDGIALY